MGDYEHVDASASTGTHSDGCSDTGWRGQVNFDFAVGASVFIFAIVFAFSVAPGIFASPAAGSQEANALRAERAAGWVTGDDVADANTYCLVELLGESTPASCGFSSTLEANLPIDGPVNATLTRNASGTSAAKLCWDGDRIRPLSASCSDWLDAGPSYTSGENVGVAQRTVTVGGNETTVTVRAW